MATATCCRCSLRTVLEVKSRLVLLTLGSVVCSSVQVKQISHQQAPESLSDCLRGLTRSAHSATSVQGPQVRAKAIKGLASTVQPGAEYQQAILERPAVVACIKRALRVRRASLCLL